MAVSPGRAYFDKRIELLKAGKIDEMVDAGYNDDALIVDFNGTVKGKQAIKDHFNQHFPMMGGVELKSIDQIVETDDALYVQITVVTGAWGQISTYEGFVLRNGKADYHFTAVK